MKYDARQRVIRKSDRRVFVVISGGAVSLLVSVRGNVETLTVTQAELLANFR